MQNINKLLLEKVRNELLLMENKNAPILLKEDVLGITPTKAGSYASWNVSKFNMGKFADALHTIKTSSSNEFIRHMKALAKDQPAKYSQLIQNRLGAFLLLVQQN